MRNSSFRSVLRIAYSFLWHMTPSKKHKEMEKWLFKQIDKAMLKDNRFIQKHIILWHWPEHMPYALNLKNPLNFNEKIQWLKLHYRNCRIPICADKYLAKKYIEKKGYGEYLPRNLGVFRDMPSFRELYKTLPMRFVVKSSEGCGGVIICNDKEKFDMSELEMKLQEWNTRCYASNSGEWFYDVLEPTFFVEEYIEPNPTEGISESQKRNKLQTEDLYDYKFFCFNGKPLYSYLTMNRQLHEKMTVDFYDIEWNYLNFTRLYPNSGNVMPRPKYYNKMLEIAEKLSEEFPLVRVDFMEGNGRLYIGEMTFCPGGGWECFDPLEWDRTFGDCLMLPSSKECQIKEREYKTFLEDVAERKYPELARRGGKFGSKL